MLSGPEATLRYIRQLDPDEWLLNDTWVEGGILMDVDAHRALFWGGDAIAGSPYLRRPLLAVLPLVWPGWSIGWALFGVVDLARAIGWDISRVLDDDFVDIAFLTGGETVVAEGQILESLCSKGSETIFTIRWKTGELKDFLITLQESFSEPGTHRHLAAPYQVLSLGPRLLSILPAESITSLPKEGSKQEPKKGAYVDEETQTIWIWENETLDPRYLEAIGRRWPGWQVQGHVEGLVHHAILSGRDSAEIGVSDQRAIQELIEELTQDQGFDPMRLSQAIQQTFPSEDLQGMKFGKGFFNAATPPLTPQERREVLERLLLGLLGNGETRMVE